MNETDPSSTRAAYRRYLDARYSSIAESTPAEVLAMQRAMLDALRATDPLPTEMRQHLAIAFEYLCEGIAFDLLTPIKRRGGREPPIAKHAQEAAIRYLRWCNDGRIADASPVNEVANAYAVSTRTVCNWCRAWEGKPTPPLFEEWGAEQVTAFMKAAGKAYRRFVPKPKAKTKTR